MINIDHLNFGYTQHAKLLQDFSLDIPQGHIPGLLGKNGAGKTTLLRLMCGLLFPHSGSCRIDENEASDRSAKFLEQIFMIPEEYYLPPINIQQYIKAHSPFYPNFDMEMVHNILREFGLDEKRKLHTLSYGQRKKFVVAFGLATNARFLFLDEPTNGLDIPSKSQFRKVIANFFTDDRTIVISTHQVKDIESLVDHIVVLDEGRLLFNQSMMDISAKLALTKSPEGSEKVFYDEDIVGGKIYLTENKTGKDSNIELEVLFNGIMTNPQEINSLFM
ncbi:MAG: ATP-binding cassette domain-containing protein [Bacteroidetes bacterium]|jgi:ABC-2 type transport system ATP-binding protein|nr:ATP-binding cassette domain-containing protein [Bacteroidota bacterium]